MDLLKRNNYQIPNDISVVGFDNYEITKYLDPSLTTMNHAKEKMGACAAEMITQMILKKLNLKLRSMKPSLFLGLRLQQNKAFFCP